MKIFLKLVDKGVWDTMINGPYEPTKVVDGKIVIKNFSEWSLDENIRAHYDVKTKNILS